MFSEERLEREGFFEPTYVRGLLEDHLAGWHDHRKLLWTLLVFQLWYERWGKSTFAPSLPTIALGALRPPAAC
jgi:asparagine synthase (glutamine-hydrolysing)